MRRYQNAPRQIEVIYDAALDPAAWSIAIERIAGFVCGDAAALGQCRAVGDLPVDEWAKEEGIAEEELLTRIEQRVDEHMAGVQA